MIFSLRSFPDRTQATISDKEIMLYGADGKEWARIIRTGTELIPFPTDDNVEVACIVVTRDPVDRKELYMGFGRGICTESAMDVQTNTDTAETRSDDQITFEALSYDGFDGKPYVRAYASDADFDKKKFFDAVMPGQTLFATSTPTTGK